MKRPATPSDAFRGLVPGTVYEPETLAEAGAVLEGLSREGHSSVFVGGGTKVGLGPAPARLHAVVRTTKLARIAFYSPSDQIVGVEAGVTLAGLQATLARHGQRLSLDAPWPEKATLGGIIAANSFGPRRARSGAVRDLILGVSLLRADGVLAKGGGRVVKNVAGFDLPKLVCGSLGTLGMIAEATLRVHPLPEATEVRVAAGLVAEEVTALVAALRTAQLEPSALLASLTRSASGPVRWDVALAFEGFGAGVAQQLATLAGLARVEVVPENPFDAHRVACERAPLRLKVATLPSALPAVQVALQPVVDRLPGAELAFYPTLGLGFLSAAPESVPADEGADRSSLLGALASARERLVALRGSLTLEQVPAALEGWLEPWTAPSSLALHRAVKSRFDPQGILSPGRFVGGI